MEALEALFRWIHIVAGIMWIGHLYFFNFVNIPFQAVLEGPLKPKVNPELIARALFWFRWGALWTWVTGVLMLLPILGFFNNGIFSGFPIYLPELYPTRLRATGAGFCFNAGRILASISPFMTGWLVTTLGSFGRAASMVALIYLVGLVVLWFAPETRGQPLKD